jgi:hypothetical protein
VVKARLGKVIMAVIQRWYGFLMQQVVTIIVIIGKLAVEVALAMQLQPSLPLMTHYHHGAIM